MKNPYWFIVAVALIAVCQSKILVAEMKVTQELQAGVQAVNQTKPEAKFEEYREVPNGIVIDRYAISGEGTTSDYSLEAKKISQEDQSANFSYGRGKLKLNASYDQTPHNWSNISQTLFNETSPGMFLLPDGMQAEIRGALNTIAVSTSQKATDKWFEVMQSTFNGLSHTQKLGTRQDKTGINLGYALSDSFSFDMELFQEKKNGKKLQAFAFGRNYAVELAKPIDQTVYDAKAGIGYKGKKMNIGINYGLSLYRNEIQGLTWDNTKQDSDKVGNSNSQQVGDASKQGRASSQPDNAAHTLSMVAGLDLPAHSHVDADIAYTLMVQDENLLPYTINSSMTITGTKMANDVSVLPSQSAGTKDYLVVQNYSLKNNFVNPLGLDFFVRSEQLGNNSKEISFDGHAYVDQIWQSRSASDADTKRIAYRKLTLGAKADYQIFHSLGFGFDFAREKSLREHREYREDEEDTIITKLDYHPFRWFSIRGKYTNANRKAMDFELSDYKTITGNYSELPGLRRSDLASRMRNAGEVSAQFWRGMISANVNGALGYDKFKSGDGPLSDPNAPASASNQEKMYGMLENRFSRAGTDIDVDFSDQIDMYVFYQYEQIRGTQRSNTSSGGGSANQDAANDWTVVSNDRYDVVGIGADFDITRRWKLMAGYDLAYSRGATDFKDKGSLHTSKANPPETISSKQDYSLRANCSIKANLSVEFGYLFEKYDVSDYATDSIPTLAGQSSNQTNMFLGDSILDYKAQVVSVKMNYKW